MLYKKAAGQEADSGAIEEGTKSRLHALEVDMDGKSFQLSSVNMFFLYHIELYLMQTVSMWIPRYVIHYSGSDLSLSTSGMAEI